MIKISRTKTLNTNFLKYLNLYIGLFTVYLNTNPISIEYRVFCVIGSQYGIVLGWIYIASNELINE